MQPINVVCPSGLQEELYKNDLHSVISFIYDFLNIFYCFK